MKLAKKLILSLLALPISSFVIFLIYVFMCLFLGEDVYLIEIGTLQDFSILLKEFIVISVAMYIALLTSLITIEKINEKDTKISTKIFSIFVLIICFCILPIILTKYLLPDLELFNSSFLILWVTFVAIAALIFAIKDFLDVWIINNKLRKERK